MNRAELMALVKGIAGTHLLTDLQGALDKIEAAFPAGMKKFLDRLPAVITAKAPVEIEFGRGVVGHHQTGRATDIYAVGGKSLNEWKKHWDERARPAPSEPERRALARRESASNLGWRLYKALQIYGRWAQPYGYPVQLFGPWTREEGPWKHISDRLLAAHRDHIHVAK